MPSVASVTVKCGERLGQQARIKREGDAVGKGKIAGSCRKSERGINGKCEKGKNGKDD